MRRYTAMGSWVIAGHPLTADPLQPPVSPQQLYDLKLHIGQLVRELNQLDSLATAAFFGQMASPPLRRALSLVVGNLRPALQEPLCHLLDALTIC